MPEKNFSIEQALKYGWKKMTENLGFFIVLVISLFIISFFFSAFSGLFENKLPSLSLIFSIGGLIFGVYMNLVFTRVGLNVFEGERGKVEDILTSALPIFLKFLLAYFLFFLIVCAGLVFLIIPGIYFGLKYQFVLYLIVDKGMDVAPAFNMSSELTKGVKWRLLLFDIIIILIAGISAMMFFVGLLITIPIMIMANVYIYKSLLSQTNFEDDEDDDQGEEKEESVTVNSNDPFQPPVLRG